ncbi:MAG: hypothetical protein JWM59_4391 [Verrucomicrobiales bacterium]|nr:hypothetical protein [Verrucomicrobiales bacterium]
MRTSQNQPLGYKNISADAAPPARRSGGQRISREDRIFRHILPSSRVAIGDFLPDSANDWEIQILREGDLLSPLSV